MRIIVAETGRRLSPEQEEGLFQVFNRVGTEGLVISKKMVELMGGMMGFSGEHGKGSSFWIELKCTGNSVA